ncbi:hypothetical protein MTBBW1_1450002 [Desulfamplus magnetovallimortis]|uniref:Uncharacterized protein n=1 Tax=Desulfamplus magnetovallimortis TaxID=1246637 RepID=A0A1W1H8C1_9BACT|nr:hypothetical protein MTBBW1_1450002 [Desulfamplus magnetovallimortis]
MEIVPETAAGKEKETAAAHCITFVDLPWGDSMAQGSDPFFVSDVRPGRIIFSIYPRFQLQSA